MYAAITLKKQTLAAAKKQTNDAGSKTLGWLRDATAGGARTTSARQVALNSKNNSDPRCCELRKRGKANEPEGNRTYYGWLVEMSAAKNDNARLQAYVEEAKVNADVAHAAEEVRGRLSELEVNWPIEDVVHAKEVLEQLKRLKPSVTYEQQAKFVLWASSRAWSVRTVLDGLRLVRQGVQTQKSVETGNAVIEALNSEWHTATMNQAGPSDVVSTTTDGNLFDGLLYEDKVDLDGDDRVQRTAGSDEESYFNEHEDWQELGY